MNRDDQDAGLAHQQELERRELEELWESDEYRIWLARVCGLSEVEGSNGVLPEPNGQGMAQQQVQEVPEQTNKRS